MTDAPPHPPQHHTTHPNTPPPHPQHTPYNSNHTTCHILQHIVNKQQISHRQHGHKIPILVTYTVHTVSCPLVGIGTLPPSLPQSSVYPPPPEPKEWGTHSLAGEGVGESLFGRLENKPSTMYILCDTIFITMRSFPNRDR